MEQGNASGTRSVTDVDVTPPNWAKAHGAMPMCNAAAVAMMHLEGGGCEVVRLAITRGRLYIGILGGVTGTGSRPTALDGLVEKTIKEVAKYLDNPGGYSVESKAYVGYGSVK